MPLPSPGRAAGALALASLPLAGPSPALAGAVPSLGRAGPSFTEALGLDVPLRLQVSATPAQSAARRRAAGVRSRLSTMVRAGDRIARRPYVYGGGHGSFTSTGYDCSGSVSYVLHAAGLLAVPEDSSGLATYGAPGRGRHVTIYANSQHVLMTIDGRRFDTIAFQEHGSRWASTRGPLAGYTVRHPAGM